MTEITKKTSTDCIRILQLSDLHLFADQQKTMLGMNTHTSLLDTIEKFRSTHQTADCILFTGDLVQDESRAGYDHLKKLADDLNVPYFCIPGNHDDRDFIREIFPADYHANNLCIDIDCWRLVLLDSNKPGCVEGHLDEDTLGFLRESITEANNRHVLIAIHHPVLSVNSHWIDQLMLDNPAEFLSIINDASNVRCVLWGHAHQEFHTKRDGVDFMGAPSTCFQFEPDCSNFSIDTQPPGYRWLELASDGRFETIVTRIDQVPEGLQTGSRGY